MAISDDFHKLAQDIDLSPTQAEAMLDFVVNAMVRVARTEIPVEEITAQAKASLPTQPA